MNRKGIAGILVLLCLVCTGCGNTIPGMTSEQEDMITLYAAKVAMKYDVRYASRLVDLSEYHEVEANIPPQQLEEVASPEKSISDTLIIDVSGKGTTKTIDEFYGLEGVSIQYVGNQVSESYFDAEQGDDLYFALEATTGNMLLILSFEVSNVTDHSVDVDFLSISPRFRISVNGESSRGALATTLLDDMAYYKGTLEVGESIKLVLVAEIAKEQSIDIQNIELTMKNESENQKISLN